MKEIGEMIETIVTNLVSRIESLEARFDIAETKIKNIDDRVRQLESNAPPMKNLDEELEMLRQLKDLSNKMYKGAVPFNKDTESI